MQHLAETSRPDDAADDDNSVDHNSADVVGSWTRVVAWVFTVGGLIAFIASLTLTIERFELAQNPDYVPSCSFNPVLSCGSVMATWQAALFGFPNPLIGIAAFALVVTVGVGLFAGARFAGWFWAGLQVGVTLGIVFIGWLIYQSLYQIGALCPYCMVVWAMMIPIFVVLSVRNAHASGLTSRSSVAALLARSHAVLITGSFLLIIALVAQRFWTYWTSLYS